jgi:membrane-bound hydrogenase subunit beta
MSVQTETQSKLEEVSRQRSIALETQRVGRVCAQIPVGQLVEVVQYLKDTLGLNHITTITAIDVGEDIEILYHFFCQGVTLTLKVSVPKADPVVDTITPILPGAILYEREIQDLLGVKVREHPDPRRLILPEDWEEGVYPLRKDYEVKEE